MRDVRSTIAAKASLRASMKAVRAAIPAAARTDGATRIAGLGLSWLPAPPGASVSGFLSIGCELDTAPLLAALHKAGHPLCLPEMQGRGKPLQFRAWAPGDAMVTALWGIQEPRPEQPAMAPDILLVPLLAAELTGSRLGYGGGFFDRTLRALRQLKPVVAIGLSFDEQVVDAVPHLDYDEPLDWLLTPSGPRRCEPR